MNYLLLDRADLPYDGITCEFEKVQCDDTDVSFIWVDMPPGGAIRLHKHPYKEILIIQEGTATFIVGTAALEARRTEHYCARRCASQIYEFE